ncbi:MAG: sigma-54-dependent Fis family transcriptional regulator, partial [Kiritimatiellae bacterium]|nr:sigma-54-dependent Fis family transcriptional regulator [Kiritimatiellia bacterium]
MKPKILIVDDEKPLRDTLARWFRPSYDCITAPDAAEAMKLVEANADLALMVTDVRMPGEDGVSLLRRAKAVRPDMGVIVLTAYGTVDLAVNAMKDGADDFFQKPITDLRAFELRVAKAVRNASLAIGAGQGGEVGAAPSEGLAEFTGSSPAMERVYRLIRKVAPTDATVIIEGPSGTGKELAARALHSLSRRADGPFVAVECSALAKDLLESELFGYAPGAFTGASAQGRVGHIESADGGTLFLDEIGEIDLSTQVKLLRVLESRTVKRVGGTEDIPVDFRLVAATNRNLSQMVAEGKFREDLYYRLNVIDIRTPALKDHAEDIPQLVGRFMKEFAAKNGVAAAGISADAMKALCAYSWPGNVRQLR